MNLLLAAISLNSGGLLHLLFIVAIAAVVIWGIVAIVNHMGVTIPPIVRIVAICLISIALIFLLFRLFGFIV